MELLQKSISRKEKEIDELQKKLQTVLKKLDETQLQIPALRKELQRTSQELASKSTEIKLLREVKEEMKVSLDIERKRYDNVVMQQTAAKISNDSYTVKNKVCIAHHIWCVQHVSIRTPYLVCYAHLPLAHHFGCA